MCKEQEIMAYLVLNGTAISHMDLFNKTVFGGDGHSGTHTNSPVMSAVG